VVAKNDTINGKSGMEGIGLHSFDAIFGTKVL